MVLPVAAYLGDLAGVRAVGDDAAVVWDGPAALVPVLLGGRGGLGPGDPGRGPRFLPLAADRRQAGGPHWRSRGAAGRSGGCGGSPGPESGDREGDAGPNVRGGDVAHCETVLRGFYDFHLEAGTGPLVNPFPLARGAAGGRSAHHNPMEPFRAERAGLFRPRVAQRVPRSIPDERFNELFAALGSHRDRALVAFWVSTGARASELLGATSRDVDPGRQLITVIRKGTRALQPLPASPDAFVWLRLYQARDATAWSPPGRTSRCGGRCGGRSGR